MLSLSNLCGYVKLLIPGMRFVNCLCTISRAFMSLTKTGDQITEQYSNSGRTYTLKAFKSKSQFFDKKQRSIKFALV